MELIVDSRGHVCCLYDEAIDVACLGTISIVRASHVEPDPHGWWADLAPVDGPRLGPFALRSEALEAERIWLQGYLLERRKERDGA